MSTEANPTAAAAANEPARKTFIRIGDKRRVTALVKEAARVGYTVTWSGTFAVTVRDPEHGDALVFKSVNVRPKLWATSYSLAYWVENTVEGAS